MTNISKYNQVFIDSFDISDDELTGLTYQSIDNWDSVGHMGMIASLEDEFDIIFEMDDIIDFSSYEIGKQLLLKYGIVLCQCMTTSSERLF
jgi:acyl carrier protein